MKKLIAISGKIGSGKSTLGSLLVESLERRGHKAKVVNFADKLKEINYILTGYYGYTQQEKNFSLHEYRMTDGESLQNIGTEALRLNYHENVWINSSLKNLDEDTFYIFCDCRFKNEARAIKEKNGIVIRINGDPALVRQNSQRNLTHQSEVDLDDYEMFDYIFTNEDFEELKKFSEEIADFLVLN